MPPSKRRQARRQTLQPYRRPVRWLQRLMVTLMALMVALSLFGLSITMGSDPVSTALREATQHQLNAYINNLTEKAANKTLNSFDQSIMHIGLLAGIGISRIHHPEAAALLYHYVYGDGTALVLSSNYFKESEYLQTKVKALSEGQHGPMGLQQPDDWRLSLALNPYYLNIIRLSDNQQYIRLYHPNIVFAPADSVTPTPTVVPIGKLQITMYDNLISAMQPTPFYVFSEWITEHEPDSTRSY